LEEPSLLLEPCFALLGRTVVLVPLGVGLLWLLSCGRRQPAAGDDAELMDHGSLRDMASTHFLDFDRTECAILVYYVSMMVWVLELCHAVSVFAVAYTVERWYFKARKTGEGVPCCGLCEAYCVCFEHHFGTLALGSLAIAATRFIRIPLGVMSRAMASGEDSNPVSECLGFCCCCCVCFFTRYLECMTKNAYIDTALCANGFCEAGRHAAEVFAHESVAEAALNTATPMLQLSGMGGISAAGGLLTMALARSWPMFRDPTSERYVEDPTVVAAVAAVICFLLAWPFLHIFDTVSDTILYCLATEEMRAPPEEDDEEETTGYCFSGVCWGKRSESERLLK